ncbi:D-3-phosphoglycerate dehydrogenase [Roseovarius nanhaiticus]|uniref:D-3-phosphoglycerate dehydrogenase n=1 Tax=Roseovarius nanhaiticus TaxID=573024 RepID=A0A1N7HKU6_9RHOB|nr:C-terminal binding protein [Roseovarius nanhaiticus]SEL25396.1 D-3-phosphoglycerate dehydrogenase [Roseovarius nanhaiticus]SIS25318.1 D-3-phosphoglycerate dehydrogenase [Roseovarius nanhaiticus]
MKIVRTDAELQTPITDAALRGAGHDLVTLPDGIDEDSLIAALADADLLLMCYTPVTARVISAAPKLRGIVKYGVGIDAIDIPAAKARGITVVNIPEYAEETVAEGAFTLMIALAKRLIPLDRQMRAHGWAWPEPRWMGNDIAGKTIGLIGFGKIGRSMARMCAQGFRADVVAYSPHTPASDMAALGVRHAKTLHELLDQSDVVSIHCVLNDSTHHLIGEAELRAMQPHAHLINVSRGAIVDEAALVRALQDSWIAGAGLDVFSDEPLRREDHMISPLYEMENVILSPHLTFYTAEAMERLERETLERCAELIEGRPVLIKSTDPRLQDQPGARYP